MYFLKGGELLTFPPGRGLQNYIPGHGLESYFFFDQKKLDINFQYKRYVQIIVQCVYSNLAGPMYIVHRLEHSHQ